MEPIFNNRKITDIMAYLGSNPSYDNFMTFVKSFLVPHMSDKFIEEDYYRDLWDASWSNRHCLMQLPRGHSKTEMIGVWMTIYLACCQPYNPFYTKYRKQITQQMLLASGEAKHAWAERIKYFFYESPYLRYFLPHGVDRKRQNVYWNDRVMYFSNGHMILLRAIGEKAIRGNHVDRLHADDLVTEQSNVVDQTIKEKWDGAVDGVTTNKRAMVQVTGTPLRFSDILFHLKERGYTFIRLPAILDYENKKILSPNRWSWDNLMETKERIGSVRFQCEYMLDVFDDSTSLIRSEWIRKSFKKELVIQKQRPEGFKSIYLGVDFAFSDRITADSSAFVILGEKEDYDEFTKQKRKVFIVLDIISRKGMSVLEQFEFMKELHEVYRFDMIAVEENSLKSIDKHIPSFNLPLKRYWTGSKDERAGNAIFKSYETVGKRNLILRMGNIFEQGNILVPYGNEESKEKAERLFNELITFAQEEEKLIEIGVHSDIGIALGYALEVSTRPSMIIGNLANKK